MIQALLKVNIGAWRMVDTIFQLLFNNPYSTGIVGATIAMISTHFIAKLKAKSPVINFRNQSKILFDEGNARISHLQPKTGFVTALFNDAHTLYECLLRGEIVSGNGLCLGWLENTQYKWLRYSEVIQRAHHFGHGLVIKGLGRGSYVGIYSRNIAEYIIAEQACYSQSMVVVPIYEAPRICRLIINETQLRVVICDNESKVSKLLDDALYTPILQAIVVIDTVSNEVLHRAQNYNISIFSFAEIEQEGAESEESSLLPPLSHDLAVISYTSGTTGDVKGVVLTHGNVVANISAVLLQLGPAMINKDDIHLSYLPLAHMFERCCEMGMLMVGGKIGFSQGNIQKLKEDFTLFKPTVFPCVPRILNKMYDDILEKKKHNIFSNILFDFALDYHHQNTQENVAPDHSGWLEWLIFRRFKKQLGGRVRLIIIGSSPSSESVIKFMRAVLNCYIVEGYGQTECVSSCTMVFPEDKQLGHVGPPLPCCSIKLVDVPQMDYFACNGHGEICVFGPIIFAGYFKNDEKTKSTIDENGWLHTGDIGMWLPNGTIKLIDRKRHISKPVQRECALSEKLENIYTLCRSVSQVFIYGDGVKSCLVGIVVPNRDFILNWCSERGIKFCDRILGHKGLKTQILNDIISAGEKEGLKPFEQVKNIHLTLDALTIENNLLTPTMKIKRHECYKYFSSEISQMYLELKNYINHVRR